MDAIGNEVGQKMRSAIKAKLMELGCYVDDELPDYIMVMVANKRSKVQMLKDLNLFLRSQTEEFVDWLQQVLKKLKEVRLTNPEIYSCTSFGELKRKASIEMTECLLKKEKKIKKDKSLSDKIPVDATKLVENRTKTNRTVEILNTNLENNVNEDSFDIPSISEVNMLDDSELERVADKIKKAKTILLKSDSEDEDFINIKADTEELRNELNDINNSVNHEPEKIEPPKRQTISLVRPRNTRKVSITQKTSPPLATNRTITITKNTDKIPENTKTSLEPPSKMSLSNNRTITIPKTSDGSKTFSEPTITSNRINFDITSEISNKTSLSNNRTIMIPKTLSQPSKSSGPTKTSNRISFDTSETLNKTSVINKITFETSDDKTVKDLRLSLNNSKKNDSQKRTISLRESLREEKEISRKIFNGVNKNVKQKVVLKRDGRKPKETIHSRLGVPNSVVSVVSLPKTKASPERQRSPSPKLGKSVPSMVTVRPRKTAIPGFCQANKALLLKAVADAQKSVTLNVRHDTKKELFTKKYKDQHLKNSSESNSKRKPPTNIYVEEQHKEEENKTNDIHAIQENVEYLPKILKQDKMIEDTEYVPSLELDLNYEDEELNKYVEDMEENHENGNNFMIESEEPEPSLTKHQFIVTITDLGDKFNGLTSPTLEDEPKLKKAPSPIVFKKTEEAQPAKPVRNIPDILTKNGAIKEKCKYWPTCKLGEACEYIHPILPCKVFPNCKFGDRCLYIHPKCKFYASCTRKDCVYSHGAQKITPKPVIKPFHAPYQALEVCKYYPNCINMKCPFYHPKPCRFGVACLNKAECGFSHNLPSKEKLTWHSVK